jgi:hypothetical protein
MRTGNVAQTYSSYTRKQETVRKEGSKEETIRNKRRKGRSKKEK